eukprot:3351431-Alexandrium_andersonii.AAC.1
MVSRGGLGLRVSDRDYRLNALGVSLPCKEGDLQPRRDEVYTISGPALRGPSAFDSDDEGDADHAE